MKLKNFPLLMQGMHEIMMDQPMSGMFIHGMAEIKPDEEIYFIMAEGALKKLEGKELRDLLSPTVYEMPGYEDLKQCMGEPALYHFCLPMNDLDEFIADNSGMRPSEYWWAKHLLEQYFDGPLRERFTGAQLGSPYAKMLAQRPKP